MNIRAISFVLLASSATAWADDCPSIPPLTLSTVPQNLHDYVGELVAYYQKDYIKQITDLEEGEPKNVILHNTDKNPALVLDIDETALSNWEQMVADQFGYYADEPCVLDDAGSALTPACGAVAYHRLNISNAIQPTLEIYNLAIAHHVTVFFITGRHEAEREATIKQLQTAGYRNWDPNKLLMEPNAATYTSAAVFKTQQRHIIQDTLGYTIIENIGDQWSDLNSPDGLQNSPGGMTGPETDVGKRYSKNICKLPNPFYFIK